jgi:glucose/arabinose dehydrogenase
MAGVAVFVVMDRRKTEDIFNCRQTQRNESPTPFTVASPIDFAGFDVLASIEGAVAMDFHPDSNEMYVATKQGTVERVVNGSATVVIDLTDQVSKGNEQGLLGMAFHPDGTYLYLQYTDVDSDTHVVEFGVDDRGVPNVDTRREVLFVEQPMTTHNGGHLAFGPDGYLWIGLGDGGGVIGGPETGVSENAQDLSTVLGSLLRIDPRPSDGSAYSIPSDNPFVGVAGARGEIWMYGLRNPWRFSFDSETGDLWVGDVGQFCWEEINFFEAAEGRGAGANLGWPMVEGPDNWRGGEIEGVTWAIHDLAHSLGNQSVTGGVVYRGDDLPELRGSYIFTDAYLGNMRAMTVADDGHVEVRSFTVDPSWAVSFTEGPDGEVYVVSLTEGVSKLVPVSHGG